MSSCRVLRAHPTLQMSNYFEMTAINTFRIMSDIISTNSPVINGPITRNCELAKTDVSNDPEIMSSVMKKEVAEAAQDRAEGEEEEPGEPAYDKKDNNQKAHDIVGLLHQSVDTEYD